ncbi:MAG: biosynthesis protein [Rhodoferax sp.]|nr:biosynthesis protein [Rhodoferax sp.]
MPDRPRVSRALCRAPRRGRFVPTPVALVAAALCAMLPVTAAHAQADEPLVLQPSTQLQEKMPSVMRDQAPTFFSGDSTTGRPDLDMVIDGNAMMRKGDLVIRADRLEYYQPDDLAKARGNVHINQAGNVYEGESLELKVEAFEGVFQKPSYQFLANGAYGTADRADFLDDKHMVMRNATYTTCRREGGPSWMPAWILKATALRIDNDEEEGVAEGAVLRFKDVPIMAFPEMSFPLTSKRKSGFLPPTIAVDSVNGAELTVPYYWNIAPNRDATFFPTVMARRGVDLGGEFRYLEPTYRGQTRLDYMPTDSLRDRSRWSYSLLHSGSIETGLAPIGPLGLNLNLNRVSDDNYWSDFGREGTSLTQRLLSNDASLTWGKGNFSTSLRVLKWQTLQDVTAPIVPPYDRLPQLTARYSRYNVNGFDFSVDGDYTQFEADRKLTLQPNAKRSYALGQISRPWIRPGWFVTPKVQLHATSYEFDAPLANTATTASRTVPTFSLDSGLIFERDASFFGRNLRQTLEPRAFYVNTPYRDQSALPNYDSALNDFNLATIYTENSFSGNDRIADNNLLTLGVTSRLYEPDTGAELLSVGVAQRLRFKDQRVVLPGAPVVSDRLSDFLVGATVNWDPRWTFDGTVQYNPKTSRSERTSLSGRWSPGNYRVISMAYRYQRELSEQIDVGWQWPINDLWGDRGRDLGPGAGQGEGRWYSVGRMNYSVKDRKLVDSILGFEYDAGCWLGRIVVERLQGSNNSASSKILFQLEFVGFTRLGSSPLKTLKENIPRYQYLRETITTPSRFGQYD